MVDPEQLTKGMTSILRASSAALAGDLTLACVRDTTGALRAALLPGDPARPPLGDAELARFAAGHPPPLRPELHELTDQPEAAELREAGCETVVLLQIESTGDRFALGMPPDHYVRAEGTTCVELAAATASMALAQVYARERAEREREWLAAGVARATREAELNKLLADAGEAMGASLDVAATATAVADAVVPRLADWCVIETFGECGESETVAVNHQDPALRPIARALVAEGRARLTWRQGVLDAGDVFVASDFPTSLLTEGFPAEARAQVERLGVVSVALLPLKSRGRLLGLLSLATAESGRRLGPAELGVAQRLAERLAVTFEHARLYQETRRTAERLEIALEAGRMGNWEFDVRTHRVWWSTALEALHGLAPGTFGGTFDDYVADMHPEDRDRVLASIQASLAHESHYVEYRIILPDGSIRWVEGRGRVLRDADGAAVRLAGVCLDVTERKRAQEAVESERARAARLESIGVLAGGIAHDFNNLLTAIVGNLSLARAVLHPAERTHRWVSAAERAALRSRDLTQQLLTFAKGGAPVRQRASLEELVRESAGFVLSGGSVKAVFQVHAALWPAEVDAGQVSQVVQNLVLNAAQASPDGGRITLRLENVHLPGGGEPDLPRGPYVRIVVEDEGVGIPPENLGRIFDPFFTTKPKGSGLGLATAYSIVRRHGGHLGATSTVGLGSAFVVYLPARPGSHADAPADDAPGTTHRRYRGRALVMDDEDFVRESATFVLDELGFEVHAAADGDEAVRAAAAALAAGRPFDVALLDLTVPGGKGGRAAVAELRALDPGVRAIVSSGYSADPVMSDHAAHGFDAVVAKPYTVEDLDAVLERLLGVPLDAAGRRAPSATSAAIR